MNILKNKKIILYLFLVIFLAGCGGGGSSTPISSGGNGIINFSIISPFGNKLGDIQGDYNSGNIPANQAGGKVIIKTFDSLGYEFAPGITAGEPNCKIGGWYKLKIFNDPTINYGGTNIGEGYNSNLKPYSDDLNLFYCKTTKDLLDLISIPKSWENDKILVYCNDGINIFMRELNFDFLHSDVNMYKSCVVRNLKLEESIFFGFDVGNSDVESETTWFFNNTNSNIITGFQKEEYELFEENIEQFELVRFPMVSYQETVDDSYGDGTTTTITRHRELTGLELVKKIEEEYPELHEKLNYNISEQTNEDCYFDEEMWWEVCNDVTTEILSGFNYETLQANSISTSGFGSIISSGGEFNPNTALYKIYFSINVSSSSTNYTLINENKKFIGNYNAIENFFELKEEKYNQEEQVKLLNEIFNLPVEFGLSRVALLLKENNSNDEIIIGYETPEILYHSINSNQINPIYKISFENYDNFKCPEILGAFNGKQDSSLSEEDMVICSSVSEGKNLIEIRSRLVDSEFEFGTGFNLFKNLILDTNYFGFQNEINE